MNPKSILNLFSILVLFFSFSYLFPIIVSLIYEDGAFNIFLKTLILVSSVGAVGLILTRNIKNELSQKDGFVIIVMFWIILSFAGSIPFYLSGMSFIDSFFESMSGITTTGATVISNIDTLPETQIKKINFTKGNFYSEKVSIRPIDYYFSNPIARASKIQLYFL